MTDTDGKRAREWLQQQLSELAQLRNANRRDPKFKQWRQQTVTVLQRIWPGDTRRVERFRRIPFTAPTAQVTDRMAREHYERGWGEAGVLLRQLLAEVELRGLPVGQEARDGDDMPVPMLDQPACEPPMLALDDDAPAADAPAAPEPATTHRGDEIGRAMDRLLRHAPVFRTDPPAPPRAAGPAAEPPALAALVRVADELDSLGVPPARAREVRHALLALARAARGGAPSWELVSEALEQSGATPGLARRLLPLLQPFIEDAA